MQCGNYCDAIVLVGLCFVCLGKEKRGQKEEITGELGFGLILSYLCIDQPMQDVGGLRSDVWIGPSCTFVHMGYADVLLSLVN